MKPILLQSVRLLLCSSILFVASCEKKTGSQPGQLNGGVTESNAVVTREYFISPVTTDPAITSATNNNFVSVQEGGVLRNTLFVFLPGTHRVPGECKLIPAKAASMGFHSIALMYSNSTAVNPICSPTNDTTCHRRMRLEVVDGIDRHPSVSVNPTHSIINRLYKLLVYLNKTYPAQNWGQYILNGKPNWAKIIISGHSQGGSLAGVIGKYYPIKKVMQFSGIDFMNNNRIPDYEMLPANKDRYFGLVSMNDELVPWPRVRDVWRATGQTVYGPFISVDWNTPPYQNSHTLVSTLNPGTTMVDKYHNCTGVDAYQPKNNQGKYVFEKAWEYMLTK